MATGNETKIILTAEDRTGGAFQTAGAKLSGFANEAKAAAAGVGKEFEYIIGAVVGGCLMTGGYGSVIGASVGAMIAPITLNGIPLSRWNSDNRFIFLGVVLLAAVLVNQKIRKKAQEAR